MKTVVWIAFVVSMWCGMTACDSTDRDQTGAQNQDDSTQDTTNPGFGGADTSAGGSGGFTIGTVKKDTVEAEQDNATTGQDDSATNPGEDDDATSGKADLEQREADIDDPIVLSGCVEIANCVVQCQVKDQSCVDQCAQNADPTAAATFKELWTCAQANCVIGDPSMGDCMATQCSAQYTACISPD